MTVSDIVRHRLINQQIAKTKFKKPHEIVSWMGAMQAQDFGMAKWAIGLRLPKMNDADVEQAFNGGAILRTHLLRPTWHFVTPADIKWILALTAPRVNAACASMYRKLGLDNKTFKRSNDVLAKTLQGGKQLTRLEVKSVLAKAKINSDGLLLVYLLMRAELDAIICSGPRVGKQFTYALLDERIPSAKALSREEALSELALRYFTSRGPATLQDFAWWSGLSVTEAKAGIAMLPSYFKREMIGGHEYVFAHELSKNKSALSGQSTFLLPDYDEYGISYKNRSAIFDNKNGVGENRDGNPIWNHMVVVDGVIGGTWRREIKKKRVVVETTSFRQLNKVQKKSVADAVKRYVAFAESKS